MNRRGDVTPEDQTEMDRLRAARDKAEAEYRAFAVGLIKRSSWRAAAEAAGIRLSTLQRWAKTE